MMIIQAPRPSKLSDIPKPSEVADKRKRWSPAVLHMSCTVLDPPALSPNWSHGKSSVKPGCLNGETWETTYGNIV